MKKLQRPTIRIRFICTSRNTRKARLTNLDFANLDNCFHVGVIGNISSEFIKVWCECAIERFDRIKQEVSYGMKRWLGARHDTAQTAIYRQTFQCRREPLFGQRNVLV